MFKKIRILSGLILGANLMFVLPAFSATCPEADDIIITERNEIRGVTLSDLKDSIIDAICDSLPKNSLSRNDIESALANFQKEIKDLVIDVNKKKWNYTIPRKALNDLLEKVIKKFDDKALRLTGGERIDTKYSMTYIANLIEADERLHFNTTYKYTVGDQWEGYSVKKPSKTLKFYAAYFYARERGNPEKGGFLRECTYANDNFTLKKRKPAIASLSGIWVNHRGEGVVYICEKNEKGKRDIKACQFNFDNRI
ncbi:MAG: hypothetical protein V4471_03035 [Pseudomonadota bacterium]